MLQYVTARGESLPASQDNCCFTRDDIGGEALRDNDPWAQLASRVFGSYYLDRFTYDRWRMS